MATIDPTPPTLSIEDSSPAGDAPAVASNEYVANSFGEYVRGQFQRIRQGDAGVLPVIVGFIIISIIFQTQDSKFLTSGNLVILFQNASIYILFGMSELFILLLGEIDLSIGYNAGVGAAIIAKYAAPPHNDSWIVALVIGLVVCTFIGLVQGLLVTRFGLPAFIVTLSGYLGLAGLILYVFQQDKYAVGGSISTPNGVISGITNNSLSTSASWIVTIALIVVSAVVMLGGTLRRRRVGMSAPPIAVTAIKVLLIAVVGIVVVILCNQNRSLSVLPNAPKIEGIPYVVLIVPGLVVIYTFFLDRTKFGRSIYAIGGNAEAARRAGIRVKTMRTACFMLAGFTAGIAGLLYDSLEGGASSSFNGGTYVLYAVAAGVIGGTSLFGGRGRMMHALLGGLVIAAIANGMGLIGLTDAAQEMVNAVVLLAAVLVDAIARRGRTA